MRMAVIKVIIVAAALCAAILPVREWIGRRGGLTSRLLLLRGRELAAIYPRCK